MLQIRFFNKRCELTVRIATELAGFLTDSSLAFRPTSVLRELNFSIGQSHTCKHTCWWITYLWLTVYLAIITTKNKIVAAVVTFPVLKSCLRIINWSAEFGHLSSKFKFKFQFIKKKACLAKSASLESHMTNVLVVCQISLLVNHITAAPISQRHADLFRCTNFWCDMNLRQHGDKKQKALGS